MVEKVAGGYLVTGPSVDVLRASNFFDLFKAYDGTLASLEPKPLNDAQTGLRPMIAARDAQQAPDHAASGSEAETLNAPCPKAWLTIEEMASAIHSFAPFVMNERLSLYGARKMAERIAEVSRSKVKRSEK